MQTQSKLSTEEKRNKSLESKLAEEKRAGNEVWVRHQQITKDMAERVRFTHAAAEQVHAISRILNDLTGAGVGSSDSAPPSPSGDSKNGSGSGSGSGGTRNLNEREDQKISRVLIAAKQNISGFTGALNSALAVQFSPSKNGSGSSAAPALPPIAPLDDAWAAVRDLINDLLPRVNERSRQILNELHDTAKLARENENRLRASQVALTEQARQSAAALKAAEDAARDAIDRVKDEATIQKNAIANDARARLAQSDQEKKQLQQLNTTLQLAEHKNALAVQSFQTEMTKMNRVIQHFAASCRLLYRGYQPLQTRCNELIEQKKFLLHQNRSLERLKSDVYGLMQAMTGGDKPKGSTAGSGGSTSGGKPRPTYGFGKRPSMRAAAIMCLAALRIVRMSKRQQFYGLPANVRGEAVWLTPPDLVSTDDSKWLVVGCRCDAVCGMRYDCLSVCVLRLDLPRIDLSTHDLSATSFSRLTHHFNADGVLAENLPSLNYNLMSALSVGFFRYTTAGKGSAVAAGSGGSADQALLNQKYDSKGSVGDDGEEVSPMVAVIRKVTLALANRIRDLEKEHKNYVKENQRLTRVAQDTVKQREEVAAHYTTACLEIKNLEEKIKDAQQTMAGMISQSM